MRAMGARERVVLEEGIWETLGSKRRKACSARRIFGRESFL